MYLYTAHCGMSGMLLLFCCYGLLPHFKISQTGGSMCLYVQICPDSRGSMQVCSRTQMLHSAVMRELGGLAGFGSATSVQPGSNRFPSFTPSPLECFSWFPPLYVGEVGAPSSLLPRPPHSPFMLQTLFSCWLDSHRKCSSRLELVAASQLQYLTDLVLQEDVLLQDSSHERDFLTCHIKFIYSL